MKLPRRLRLGPVWRYTLLRFVIFVATAAVLWVVGLRSWALAFTALLLSLPISLVVLRKPRAEFAHDLERRARRRRELRAKLMDE